MPAKPSLLNNPGERPDPELAASAAIRAYCGWHIAPVLSETLVLDAHGWASLWLPTQKIVKLTRVVSDGVDVTGRVEVSEAGMLRLAGGFSSKLGGVRVELDHGFDLAEVPEVASLVADVAARAVALSPAVKSKTTGPYSLTIGSRAGGGSAGGVPLFIHEKALLDKYRIHQGP